MRGGFVLAKVVERHKKCHIYNRSVSTLRMLRL